MGASRGGRNCRYHHPPPSSRFLTNSETGDRRVRLPWTRETVTGRVVTVEGSRTNSETGDTPREARPTVKRVTTGQRYCIMAQRVPQLSFLRILLPEKRSTTLGRVTALPEEESTTLSRVAALLWAQEQE